MNTYYSLNFLILNQQQISWIICTFMHLDNRTINFIGKIKQFY